jgi:hypothetical protein
MPTRTAHQPAGRRFAALRSSQRELRELRERMRAEGPVEREDGFCHFIDQGGTP